MQFKNTIAVAFAALFMAVSCVTVDKSLGSDLIPDNQDMPIEFAEIKVPVQLKSSQPLQTLSSSESVFGAIRTSEFGLAEFAVAADFQPNFRKWDFGKDIVVKDVYFLANVSQIFVTDDQQKGIPQIVTVHRTYRNIDTTTVFNNTFTEADYNPEPVNRNETIYFGGDSLKITLKKSFAEEILTATVAERDTLDLFRKRFKGLLIKSSVPEEGTTGGRQNFINFGSGTIYISVNFQPTWQEGLARKDTLFALTFGGSTCLNISRFESKSLETETPGAILELEGAAGVKPYISKEDLKFSIDAWKQSKGLQGKNIIITRGALVFPFEIPENLDMSKYPPALYPCNREYDSTYRANIFYPALDVNVQGYSVGLINRSLEEYRMDIPSLIQDFVSKDASELNDLTHNLWIMPIYSASTNSYYNSANYQVDGNTYYTGKLNGPTAARYPKLEIVYSVVE